MHCAFVPQDILNLSSFKVFGILFVQQPGGDSELREHTPVLVDDVADDERGEEEQAVAGHSALRLHVDLVDGDDFALGRGRLSHHLQQQRGQRSADHSSWTPFLKRMNSKDKMLK